MLEQRLGRSVELLAYPYGTAHTVSQRDERLAAESGYRAAFLDMTGALEQGIEIMSLPRRKVLGTDSMFVVGASLDSRMDSWRVIERRG